MHITYAMNACVCVRVRACDMEELPLLEILGLQVLNMLLLLHCTLLPTMTPCSNDWLPED